MKERPKGFLACDKIDHEGEIFDYIRELHEYLHKFTGGGNLGEVLDASIERYNRDMTELIAYRRLMDIVERRHEVVP